MVSNVLLIDTNLDSSRHCRQINRCDVTKLDVRIRFKYCLLLFTETEQLVDQVLDLLGSGVLDELGSVTRITYNKLA